MSAKASVTRAELKKRLGRIEGQVRGISKMLDEERDCQDVLQQLAAVRSAAQQVSLLLARSYASECVRQTTISAYQQEKLAGLIDVLSKAT